MDEQVLDPPVPYIGPIPGGRFSPGKTVHIQGTTPAVAYRFDINLQCGMEILPHDDIAMQLSVRLLDGNIGINSFHNGTWGEEEIWAIAPIRRAEKFEITLICDFNKYKICINKQHSYEFPQRIHYDRISYLTIDGDTYITEITFNCDLTTELHVNELEVTETESLLPPSYTSLICSNQDNKGEQKSIEAKIVPRDVILTISHHDIHSEHYQTVVRTYKKWCCVGFGTVIMFSLLLLLLLAVCIK